MFVDKNNTKQESTHIKCSTWKQWFIAALVLLSAIISFNPTSVYASDSLFLGFTYNEDGSGIRSSVNKSNVNNGVKKHTEIKKGGNFLYKSGDKRIFTLNKDESKAITIAKVPDYDEMASYFPSGRGDYVSGEDEWTIPFSFPGRHVGSGGMDRSSQRQADANDLQQANFVAQQLTSGFNQLLNIAVSAEKASGEDVKIAEIHNIAAKIANAGVGSPADSAIEFGEGDNKVSMSFLLINANHYKNVPTGKYIDSDFFRQVEIVGKNIGTIEELVVPVAVNKGYDYTDSEERLYSIVNNTPYGEEKYAGHDVHHISWQHMVLQAGHNASVNQVFSANQGNLANPGRVEKTVTNMFGGIADSIKSWLGLQPITDLVFNKGTHDATSVYGTMPISLGNVADMLYLVMLVLAIGLMSGSLVSLLIKSNLSVINPQMRVDMKDSLLNIVGASFLLVAFQPLWRSAMVLNYHLVDYFFHISDNISELNLVLTAGSGGIAAAVLSIAFLILEIWFNFYYIVRALTIMVLYMFAPLMIVSVAYGGKYKQIFSSWLKEILGALFGQAIHAAVLGAVFAGLGMGMASSLIWQFVVLTSIIPLSDMIRSSVLNLGGDSIGSTASKGQVGLMASGAAVGGLALKGASMAGGAALGGAAKLGGGGKGGSGGGSGGKGGGGGGGGSSQNAGKTKLGDSVADASGKSSGNAGVNFQEKGKMGQLKAQFGPDKSNAQKAGTAAKMAGNAAAKGIGGAARSLKDGAAGKALKGAAAVAAGFGAAGATVGDAATGNMGGSLAMRAGKDTFKGNNKNKGGGSYGGDGGDDSASLLDMKEDGDYLEMLESQGMFGSYGELMNQNVGDETQVMTSSNELMAEQQGGSNYKVSSPSTQHPAGATTHDLDYKKPLNGKGKVDESKDLTPALERASELSGKRFRGEKLSEKENRQLDTLKRNTGISNVERMEDGKYRMTYDHESLGWKGAEMDNKHYMVHADKHVDKRLPSMNDSSHDKTQNLQNWNMNAAMEDISSDSSRTETFGS